MLEETLTLFYLFNFIPVSVTSIVDILIVAFVFYQLLGLIRGTRAAQMLVGLFVMVSVAVAAPWLRMEALSWLLRQVQPILLILLVILFQPELRRILAVLGQSPVVRWFYKNEPSRVIDEIVSGAEQLAEAGYGALIVVGREVGLGPVIATGVQINAQVSADLLATIFTPRSTLHDQAVIIQGETLVSARCTLPLAEEVEDERLGTRHRAAVGLSQESDAATVVVSEESRLISLAVGGQLVRGIDGRDLKRRLVEHLTPGDGKLSVPVASGIASDETV